MKLSRRWVVVAAAALSVGSFAWLAAGYAEHKFLSTGPNGTDTPATLGVPYERIAITSGSRQLDGFLVKAAGTCTRPAAVLIFHGVGETISYWPKAQKLLYDRCVSSLVFDYSGHGASSPPGTIGNLKDDALAAYSFFASRFGGETRRCVLGHSMGNGAMLAAIAEFQPRPACVVVANAFSSLRDLAARFGTPRFVVFFIPDDWDNVINVAGVHVPLLIVTSDADSVNPATMGKRIFDAAAQPKRLLVLHGFRHNALYRTPAAGWWSPVLAFLQGKHP